MSNSLVWFVKGELLKCFVHFSDSSFFINWRRIKENFLLVKFVFIFIFLHSSFLPFPHLYPHSFGYPSKFSMNANAKVSWYELIFWAEVEEQLSFRASRLGALIACGTWQTSNFELLGFLAFLKCSSCFVQISICDFRNSFGD